jgi:hypothetical protein
MMTKALQNAHKSNHARRVAKIVNHNPIILGNWELIVMIEKPSKAFKQKKSNKI